MENVLVNTPAELACQLIDQITAEIRRHRLECTLKQSDDNEQCNNNIKTIFPLKWENSVDKRLKNKRLNKPEKAQDNRND